MREEPSPETAALQRFRLTTEEFAAQYFVEPQTVRKHHSAKGSYFGVRPLILPSGRLLWPDDSLEKLLRTRGLF